MSTDDDTLVVTGKKVCKLICVEVNNDDDVEGGKAKQSNKFYNMYEQDDDTFITERVRIDGAVMSDTFPMSR